MKMPVATSTFRNSTVSWPSASSLGDTSIGGEVTKTLLLQARRQGAKAQRIPATSVVETATQLAVQLEELGSVPDRVSVSRENTIVFSWIKGSKIVSLECDEDQDQVLLLDDRATTEEAFAEVVTLRARKYIAQRIAEFLGA